MLNTLISVLRPIFILEKNRGTIYKLQVARRNFIFTFVIQNQLKSNLMTNLALQESVQSSFCVLVFVNNCVSDPPSRRN